VGKFERLPALATELVQLKVDIIVAMPAATRRGAKKARVETEPVHLLLAKEAQGPRGRRVTRSRDHETIQVHSVNVIGQVSR
jgi:hypothetical protein